jgi:phenylacetate-CoA ligase
MLFANGYKITDRLLSITHPQFIKKDKKNFFQYLRLFNTKYISIFNHPEENLNFILNFQPNIIRSYIHSIKEIAEEIMKKDIKICNISLVFTTGDFLSKEDREFIANIIKADIIDYYSSTECGLIAWECKKHMGYHINSDTIILELVNHKGERVLPEEIGEVLITNLDQYTMPLIRYAIGDYAILSNTPCSCGRTLPLLKAIIGRNTGLL